MSQKDMMSRSIYFERRDLKLDDPIQWYATEMYTIEDFLVMGYENIGGIDLNRRHKELDMEVTRLEKLKETARRKELA